MITATENHLATIRARRIDDTARAMQVSGIILTHAQADELGDEGMDWLAGRMGLLITETDAGVTCAPYALACD